MRCALSTARSPAVKLVRRTDLARVRALTRPRRELDTGPGPASPFRASKGAPGAAPRRGRTRAAGRLRASLGASRPDERHVRANPPAVAGAPDPRPGAGRRGIVGEPETQRGRPAARRRRA